ncbi:hypothetical protein KSS87_005200 [Heliosperma pusillum]|nr:hypothetical protein KSS87_005200 [Heliosperma pusillum]
MYTLIITLRDKKKDNYQLMFDQSTTLAVNLLIYNLFIYKMYTLISRVTSKQVYKEIFEYL